MEIRDLEDGYREGLNWALRNGKWERNQILVFEGSPSGASELNMTSEKDTTTTTPIFNGMKIINIEQTHCYTLVQWKFCNKVCVR